MQDFTAALHNMSMHYVVIVDPGIKVDKGYSAYDQGLKDDIFVKDVTGSPYLGQVSFKSTTWSWDLTLEPCIAASE